ncbi:AAA family ATPase [Streptomyces virginiae]|uniref:AAA family ATPase n=1 Tax=Streptomyces virginiae TaxID=1961 RepID=UPI0036B816A3
MTRAKIAAKSRGKETEPPKKLRGELTQSLERLGDPLGDILALLDSRRLGDLLNRMGKTRRTRLLQRLRVPAMGKLTPTICAHALSQLRAARPPGQRLLDAQSLGGPLNDSLAQARAQWLEGHPDSAFDRSLEEAPRDELLLAALAFWDADPGQAYMLAWALRNRALPSWPTDQVTDLAQVCDRLTSEWIELHTSSLSSRTPPTADSESEVAREIEADVDTQAGCHAAADRIQRLLASAVSSSRHATDALCSGNLPEPGAWEPVQELIELTRGLRTALAPYADEFSVTPLNVPEGLPGLEHQLRERAHALGIRGELWATIDRITRVEATQPHPAIEALQSHAEQLCSAATWQTSETALAILLKDIVGLADAVALDDDQSVERLDGRLRGALPEALRPVVLLVVRGKATFPAGSNASSTAGRGSTFRGSETAALVPSVRGTRAKSVTPENLETELLARRPTPTAETRETRELDETDSPAAAPVEDLYDDTSSSRLTLGSQPDPKSLPVAVPPARNQESPSGLLSMPSTDLRETHHPTDRSLAKPARPDTNALVCKPDDLSCQHDLGDSAGHDAHVAGEAGKLLVRSQASTDIQVIVDALAQGEAALAHHAARAANRKELASSLKMFVLAEGMRTPTGACSDAFHNETATWQDDTSELDQPDQLLRAAACLRVCLVSGSPETGEVLLRLTESLHEMPSLRTTLTIVAETCARGQLTAQALRPGPEASAGQADVDVTSVSAHARESLTEQRTLHFPRANEIVRAWWSGDGLIGSLLHSVADDDRARLDIVRAQLLELRKPDALERKLTKTDSERREKSSARLQGAARRRILQYAQESLEIVHGWLVSVQNLSAFTPPPVFSHLAARLSTSDTDLATELKALGHSADSCPDPLLKGTAALALASLRRSTTLLTAGRLPGPESTPSAALNIDLLRCAALEFDTDLNPLRPVTIEDVFQALGCSWESAARDHAAAENFDTARAALEMFELDGGRAETVGKIREEHHRLRVGSRQELNVLHQGVKHRAETASRLGQLPEPGRSRVMSRLQAAEQALVGDNNLGTIRRECEEIVSLLDVYSERARNAFQAAAAQQLNNSEASTSVADRIRVLIAQGDLATAEEFLIAAREGFELPTADPVTDFDAFFPVVCEALQAGITPELIRQAAHGGNHQGLDFSDLAPAQRSQAADALTAMQQLHGQWGKFRDTKKHLKLALRLAGIEYSDEPDPGLTTPLTRRWFDITDVKLVGPCRLPQFGSDSNGRLRVMTTRAISDVRTLFGWIQQDVSQLPVLVVVAGVMSVAQRRALARECVTRRDKPVLVLDAAALAFLAARGTGLFATAERILAPFSAITPYYPEASDTLPAEMFYGRSEELSAVLDPQGSSILYGGRRLGKSALLKAAAARHRQTKHHLSLYIPLPSGMSLTPKDIWDLIARSLKQSGIAEHRRQRANTMHQVEDDITRWLNQDRARRLLILFDECDEFFDGDARENFVHTTALRNLMSSSERRFKPVFAGLHQVQRFASLPNQPLAGAHFGEPMVIGPLSPGAAYRLLHEPMQALGIRFQSDTLIHRALAYANYHPKIIQHIGLALVQETHSRRTPADGPPWTIDEETLERVIGSGALAKSIRDTVRLTLHLDPRYKLIALVLALHAYKHGVDQPIAGRDLRTECVEWWPKALSATPPDEYRALLEEMAGLGVLAADATGWRLRSSNVLLLLGSPASIEEELSAQEDEAVTALSAAHARRTLPDNRISPLTEAQIADLTRRRNGLRIVVGPSAAGLEDVVMALTEQQQRVPTQIAPLIAPNAPNKYRTALQSGRAGRQHQIIISDMRRFGATALRDSLDQALALQPPEGVSRCVVALVDPYRIDHLRELTAADEENTVLLQLATTDGLRSWTSNQDPMAPYSDPAQRAALLKTTGGWPSLLNRMLALAVKGLTPRKALAQLTDELRGIEGARLLEAIGLIDAVELHPLVDQLVDFDAPLPMEDLTDLLQTLHPDIHLQLIALQRMNVLNHVGSEGLAMEPVVAAAWRRHSPS